MSAEVEFYFDFMSPYSYLAFTRVPALVKKYGCTLRLRPVDLSVLKLAAGNTGPATRDIPIKIAYAFVDLQRWAALYGVPFCVKPGMSLRSELINKGALYAISKDQGVEYVQRVWSETFGKGQSMDDPELIAAVVSSFDWNIVDFNAFVSSESTDRLYRQGNSAAHENGVFGVPTVQHQGQLWWGNDRLDFLEKELAKITSS